MTDNQEAPRLQLALKVAKQSLKNAQEAEAIVQFTGNKDADFSQVYEKDGDAWRLLTGSSATTIYLPKGLKAVQLVRLEPVKVEGCRGW